MVKPSAAPMMDDADTRNAKENQFKNGISNSVKLKTFSMRLSDWDWKVKWSTFYGVC